MPKSNSWGWTVQRLALRAWGRSRMQPCAMLTRQLPAAGGSSLAGTASPELRKVLGFGFGAYWEVSEIGRGRRFSTAWWWRLPGRRLTRTLSRRCCSSEARGSFFLGLFRRTWGSCDCEGERQPHHP
jgi:hypothetical protein